MSSSSSFFFTKLPQHQQQAVPKRTWYLQTQWTDETFTVHATDCLCVWKGTADARFIRTSLKPDEVSVKEYLDLIRPALTQENPGEKYSCTVEVPDSSSGDEDSADEVSVLWKVSLNKRLSIKGSLALTRIKNDEDGRNPMEAILDMNAERLSALEIVSHNLQRECDDLRSKVSSTCAELAKIAERKSRLEMDMYKKFCVILNQKKEKIRSLKALLSAPASQQTSSQGQLGGNDGNKDGEKEKNEYDADGPMTEEEELDNDSANEYGDEEEGEDDDIDKTSRTLNPDGESMPSLDLLDLSLDGEKGTKSKTTLCSVRRRHVIDKSDDADQKGSSSGSVLVSSSSPSSSSSSSLTLSGSIQSFQNLSMSSSPSSSGLGRKKSVLQAASPAKKRKAEKDKKSTEPRSKRYKQLRLDNMDPDDLIGMADT